MVRVIWKNSALQDLKEIRRYISGDSRKQARRVCTLIKESTRKLVQHPEFGAVVPEFGVETIREIRVFQYRIIYRITNDGEQIDILSVYHGARELTDEQIEQ